MYLEKIVSKIRKKLLVANIFSFSLTVFFSIRKVKSTIWAKLKLWSANVFSLGKAKIVLGLIQNVFSSYMYDFLRYTSIIFYRFTSLWQAGFRNYNNISPALAKLMLDPSDEGICRRQFQCGSNSAVSLIEKKALWEKKKMLVSRNVFIFFSQGVKSRHCEIKG